MSKVIITAKAHPVLMDKLTKRGFEVIYAPWISYPELAGLMEGTEGLVVTTRIQIDRQLIDKAAELKWINRCGIRRKQRDKMRQ
jgi:D-3-phosphoglycerate dehydrogenase